MTTTIEKIERLNLTLLGVGAVLAWVTGWLHAPSLLLGGGVMQLNFWLLKRIVRALLTSSAAQERRGKRRALFVFIGKIVLSLLLLSGLFYRYPVQPWSFLVGVSLLLVTCMIVTLLEPLAGPQVEDHGA